MDPALILTVVVSCLVGGLLKGVSGSGLPPVAVPLIALLSDVPTAIAIVQIPTMSINLMQAYPRTHPLRTVLPHWPIAATLFLSAILGVSLLRVTPPTLLLVLVAGLTLVAALFLVLAPAFTLSARARLPVGIPMAAAAGVTAGMSSLAGTILVPYFMALRLPKDVYIPVLSLCYLSAILPTIGAFLYWNVVEPRVFVLSALAVIPALLGMWYGNRMRDRIDERQFRYVVLVVLAGSALLLIGKALAPGAPLG
ncbi:MAG: sulfite exporter TauE/SafE family protein [Rhodobacteraceae bacterium]|nr:MAG: sulfite exporter TauE/SafE family protein [Paracoccaceae bacterium]